MMVVVGGTEYGGRIERESSTRREGRRGRRGGEVIFFAKRDISAGEEITYDYHFNREDEEMKIPCSCNSINCRRSLN